MLYLDQIEQNEMNVPNEPDETLDNSFCDDNIVLGNRLGTCWNQAIQMIIYFSDKTRSIVQHTLLTKTAEEILNDSIDIFIKFAPPHILNDDDTIKDNYRETIIQMINVMIKRFKPKREEYDIKMNLIDNTNISSIITNEMKKSKRRNSIECEHIFTREFLKLFDIERYKNFGIGVENTTEYIDIGYGGYSIDSFFMINFLSTLLLNKFINSIYFTHELNLSYLDSSKLLGVYVSIPKHAMSFYTCNGEEKLCDNNTIVSYRWKTLIRLINELEKDIFVIKYDNRGALKFENNNVNIIFNTPVILIKNQDRVKKIIQITTHNIIHHVYDEDKQPLLSNFSNIKSIIEFNLLLEDDDNIQHKINNIYYYYIMIKKHSEMSNDVDYNYAKFLHKNKLLSHRIPFYYNEPILAHYIHLPKKNNFVKNILDQYNETTPISDMFIDFVYKNGNTTLMNAVLFQNNYIVNKILNFYSSNITTKNNNNKTVFDIVFKRDYDTRNKMLLNILHHMCKINNLTNKNTINIILNLIHNLITEEPLHDTTKSIVMYIIINKIVNPAPNYIYFKLLKMSLKHNIDFLFDILLKQIEFHNNSENRNNFINVFKYIQLNKYFTKINEHLMFSSEEINYIFNRP